MGVVVGLITVLGENIQTPFMQYAMLAVLGLILVVYVVLLIVSLRWMIFRLHDVGLSGWWYFISFIPYIGALVFLVLLLMPTNQFDQYRPVGEYVD